MAKQPTGMFDYVSQAGKTFLNKGRQYTSPTPRRTGATIDLSPLKTAPKGGAGGLESRQIPAAIQEAGPEAMSVEGGEASMQPQMVTETQQPIENRGGSARYMIQGGGPRIDLSFLVPERANKAFDPSKAIGGENVPFQESRGVGGFFRRMLGDESNQQNIAAQQAQGAEWRQEAKELKAEERLLNRMREGDKPTQARFEATQLSNKESEANRVAAENKRIEAENKRIALEGERVGLTKQQIQDAKDARTADLQLQRQQMLNRVTQDQAENDYRTNALAQNLSISNKPQMISLRDGSMGVLNPVDGSISIVNPETPGFGNMPGTPSTTKQVYPQVKAPVNPNPGGGGQVDRGTGATLGGPLTTPTRSGISLGGALNEPTQLPPGGGVRMGGALPPPQAAVVTQPRSAETVPEEGYSMWTGRYPGQPEPVMGRLNFETTRKFLGPLGEDISGASDRFAEPVKKLDLTNPEMNYDREAYKKFLRRQMGSY